MAFRLIILFLVTISFQLSRAEDPMAEARKAWELAPVHELTDIGRWVETKILKKKGINSLNPSEEIFIKNNPDAVMVVQNSACRSLAISYALCGVNPKNKEFSRAWDEEADAVRHFVFSSFLACSRGKTFAEFYTIAHEGPPQNWEPPSVMDIQNNYTAFKWATDPANHCLLPMTDVRMAQTALKFLIQKKLVTLRSGDTFCAKPEQLLNQNWDDFTERVNLMHEDLKASMASCKPGLKNSKD